MNPPTSISAIPQAMQTAELTGTLRTGAAMATSVVPIVEKPAIPVLLP
jgi:hypothetical protein